MDGFFIYNFNFSIGNSDRRQLGSIKITKNGDLEISSGIIKYCSEEEILELSNRTLSAFSTLSGMPEPIKFFIKNSNSLYYDVIKRNLKRETIIGTIRHKDHRLSFESKIPPYLRNLCVQKLSLQNEIDFYYHNIHYGNN